MKTNKSRISGTILAALLLSTLGPQLPTLFAQGTAFTYQGRLNDGGTGANGSYDFQFTIYDSTNVPGNIVGAPITSTAIAVNNGLFTVSLDFGDNVFSGDPRWLEIAARPNGAGAFTRLAPRQQMSAAPYALAARAVTGSVAASQLTGTIQPANIGAGTINNTMLATGSIHSNHLAAGSVHSNALVIGSIHSNHLAVGSVHSNALALGSVTATALAAGAVHSNHLAIGSVHSNALVIGSIHSNHLAAAIIHSNHLAVGIIHSNHLAAGSIHSNALALGSVTATALAAGTIHSNHLAVGSVHSNALVIGSIHSNHLAGGSIHSNHLAVGSVHSNALALGSVTATALAAGAVHSNHLAVGSVHSNALVIGSIHSNHLAVGSIHSNHLAAAIIHSNHLAAGSIHSNALALGSVTATALAAGSIHSNHLAVGSVHSNALVIGSIHSNHLAVGIIHSNHLAAGSVHSNALALGSVTAAALAAGSIHSNHLAAGSVHSNALVIGSIHSNHLAVGSIHSNHLAAGSVHSNALALGSITATALAAGSIHSNHLAVGSIHSNSLAEGVVTLDKLPTILRGSYSTAVNKPAVGNFEYFGSDVAAVGADKLLVGAYQDSTGWDNGGAAYLFRTDRTLLRTFLSPTPQNQEHFGFAVAAVGQDMVLIGADANDTGALDAGAAHLFSTSGAFVTTITNPTPAASDAFGFAVAAVGADKVLIGAYADHFGANNGGAAYLFTTNGTLLATFNNPTPASGDRFGIAVAAVGSDRVLIGADRDDAGATDAGVAHLFQINGTLLGTITNPTPAVSDAFGYAVAGVGPDKVLIGAWADNSAGNAGGAAYLFNTSGTLLTTITNPTPASGDQFGVAVEAVGTDALLISAAHDSSGGTDAGAAYLFSIEGSLLSTFNNPAPATGDLFGNALAAGTDKLFVAALQDDAGATDCGAVYVFALESVMSGLVAETVRDGAITAAKLDSTIGLWTRSGGNVYRSSGNVGIGTASPQTPLQVSGNNSQLRLHDLGVGNFWNIYTENHPSGADGNLVFAPGPTGAYGYIQKSSGSYFSSSDERLKQDINGLGSVLDRVLQLRPVSYRFKSAPASSRPVLGLIAQEVEPLFPEVVSEHDGLKALAYAELVPVTVGAIQELNQKLEERADRLEKELKRRDAENEELKRSVDELKRMVNVLARKFNGGEQ